LNQSNIRNIKQQKKDIRDSRRRKIRNDIDEEMQKVQEQNNTKNQLLMNLLFKVKIFIK